MEDKLKHTISGDYQYKKINGGIEIYKSNYDTPWVTITEEALIEDYAKLIDVYDDIDSLIENSEKVLKVLS